MGNDVKYDESSYIPNKFLMPDGSIQLLDGTIYSLADTGRAQLYLEQTAIPAKFLMPDGSLISALPISGGGTPTQITQIIDASHPPAPLIAMKLDGSTDDAAALNACINYVQITYGKGLVTVPYGTAIIGSSILMQTGVYVEFRDTILQAKSGISWSTGICYFNNVNNCGILGRLEINGNRLAITGSSDGITIKNGSTAIRIDQVTIHDCAEDGIYIGNTEVYDIKIERIVAYNNGRNGVSVTAVNGLDIGTLISYNHTTNSPQLGVDFEPNNTTDDMKNIHVKNMICHDNSGGGFQCYGQTQAQWENVVIDNIQSYNQPASVGVTLKMCRYITIGQGEIYNNLFGFDLQRDVFNIILKCSVYKNKQRGISIVMTSQAGISRGIYIYGDVYDNSQASAGGYDGIQIQSDDAAKLIDDVVVWGNIYDDQTTHTQRYGVNAYTNVGNIKLYGRIWGNVTAALYTNNLAYNEGRKYIIVSNIAAQSNVPANSAVEVSVTANGINSYTRVLGNPTGMDTGFTWNVYAASNAIKVRLSNITTAAKSTTARDWVFIVYED